MQYVVVTVASILTKNIYMYPLFTVGTMTEINQLRMALQESSTARNVAEGQCISLKVSGKYCISETEIGNGDNTCVR